MNPRLLIVAFAAAAALACGGQSTSERLQAEGHAGDDAQVGDDATGFGTQYQGDGVQCGALVCSGTQQCCLVYIAADANSSNPTHACDQDCQSVCADTCPDAGGQTSSAMPAGGGPMGNPMGMGGPMGDAMAGMGGPMDMGPGPMGGMGKDGGDEGGPSADPGAPPDAGKP